MIGEPIATSTPIETDGALQVYNWDDYFYKKVLKAFEDEYDVKVEWTTFNNMEEGIQKLVAGQVTADVFFPTTDYIRRLVATRQPAAAQPRAAPEPRGERLAGLLRSGTVVRPRGRATPCRT